MFHTELDPNAPCPLMPISGVIYKDASAISLKELIAEVREASPSLIVTSGWTIKKYKKACEYFNRKEGVPTMCKIDTQWLHTFRQWVGFVISPWFCKRSFSYMLVPGVRQYEFARKLGYDDRHVAFWGLSGDIALFNEVKMEVKKEKLPKKFIFAARLVKAKGLDVLLEAWNSIEDKRGWMLEIIGSGPEKERLRLDTQTNVKLLPYMQQPELVKYIEDSGVYILPSIYEPWALTIHEFAAAGMPLLCSDACGAVSHLLITGFNGFTFEAGNSESLRVRMEQLINMKDEQLYEMGVNSRKLARQITPEFTAASIISVLK